MLTPKMSGIFDCRAYDQTGKLDHKLRRMLSDTDNVTFSAIFALDAVPEQFMQNGNLDEFCRTKASKREREAAAAEGREAVPDIAVAKFKIGQSTKWYDRHGQACARPTNQELEDGRYNAQIDFVRRERDESNALKPSGYWVNAIMICKANENPFQGQEFEPIDTPDEPEPENSPDDLPFN